MWLRAFQFLSLLLVALTLAPAMAHLLELPNKMALSHDEYFIVQQIYRGWALLGFVVFGALFSTLILAVIVRHNRKIFILTVAALICIAGSLIVFFSFTYPVNQLTNNWTRLPENWLELRRQWEYSHATGAVLYLLALVMLLLSVLSSDKRAAR
jgi:ribose/xylose/arabinose/galactoside ABC-type transport system permease subunit